MKEKIEKRLEELKQMEIKLNEQYVANLNAIKGAIIELTSLLSADDKATDKVD